MNNPILALTFEPALESLGSAFYSRVVAAEFPQHWLRFRNDAVLAQLGLAANRVTDHHLIEALGQFQGRDTLLALCYHGYQFGIYNPRLGDGRGFLYGQVRGVDGELYDLGTKGSGSTPYSRGADGRLTLKGGVREVLASEALHHLGVCTSRCLSLIETGERLWRGDEPSPTRSSVMVRVSRSHIRFGTFERLCFLQRPDLIQVLLDHVIEIYYPGLLAVEDATERYGLFYAELVRRTAVLVGQWMSVGFCHAVLNTDNMSITGESFDYGPYAFMPTYDPQFTAAYFDEMGRYRFGNQPGICRWNLEMLQRPLAMLILEADMQASLAEFDAIYAQAYVQRMLQKLGLDPLLTPETGKLVQQTLAMLEKTQMGYHDFFAELRQQFSPLWQVDVGHILSESLFLAQSGGVPALESWRQLYYHHLQGLRESDLQVVAERLRQHNPLTVLLRSEIEAVWEPIATEDDWQPFYELLKRLQNP
uniref:protein adenylyltransferase SelO n=1 Tax=Petrachloros mirabilis TaxID=2918835 RepID=UPI00308425FF